MLHYISRFLRGFLTAMLIVLVLLVAAVAYLGFTASGNQFLASRIAEQVSTPDMQVSLEGASGLLEGRFHLDRVTLADTRGKFAEVQGLDLFWNPSELLKWRFHADRIAAEKVTFDRPPVRTIESTPSDSSFSLPIEIKVDSFDLPTIALGKAIAKQDTVLGINGSAQAVADRIALDLSASEKDRLNATAKATVTYAVNAQTLTLDGAVSEPQGGLLARLLALPGQPPVEIALKGDGPIRDWKGSISGRVAGKDVLLLSGSYRQAETGIHEIMLNGGGRISEFMPAEFRPLFEGETKVDVDARFAGTGLVDIRSGTITNDSFRLVANGALDPKGEARLTADISPARQAVHVELPLASGPVRADVTEASLTLSGAFRSATADFSAELAGLVTPDIRAGKLALTARSGDLDLADKTATLSYDLSAATLAFANPDIAKVVQGPVRLKGNLSLSPDSIAVAQSDLESARLGGKLSGRFDRTSQTAAANFNLFLLPQGLLPPAIEAKIAGPIGLTGQLAATLPSAISLQNLKLSSNLVNAVGSASLDGETVKAAFAGDVLDIADFADKAAGKVHFTVAARGPLAKPDIAANFASTEVRVADKALQSFDLSLTSTLDLKKPAGKLALSANYQGQPVNLSADAAFDNGKVAIPALSLAVGENGLTGALSLDAAFLPSGRLAFDFPDIAGLARLAGQDAAGALKGTIDLAPHDGRIAGTLTADGPRLSTAGVEIANPGATIEVADLLARAIKGKVTAEMIAAGANHLDKVALDFDMAGQQIGFDLASLFDAAPLTASGTVLQQEQGLTVKLASFAATPRTIPVTLAAPTEITVKDGLATLAGVTIKTGNGSLVIDGTAGETLDLTAKIADLPLNLANSFARDLDAAGTLSGNLVVSGNSASPAVSFDTDVKSLATSQTRKAGLPPLFLAAKGQFADKRLSVDVEREASDHPSDSSFRTALLKAEVQLGDTIRVPSFRLDFDKNTISGALSLDRAFIPSGRIDFDLPDIAGMAAFVGRKAEGALKGTVDLASKDGRISARVSASGDVRGQAIEALVEATSDHGALALPSLKVDIGRNTLSGAVTLDGKFMPSGKIAFDFPDVALLTAMAGQKAEGAIKGSADIASRAGRIDARVAAIGTIRGHDIDIHTDIVSDKGVISIPALDARIGPNSLSAALALDSAYLPSGKVQFDFPDVSLLAGMAGQKAEGAIRGTADIASANGKIDARLDATGTVRSQAIGVKADVVADKGAVSVPSLRLAVGDNILTGGMTLDRAFMPSGTFSFDFPDIGPLAAFAGQEAQGALSGTATLQSADGKISGLIDARGENITAAGTRIEKPAVDLKIADLVAGQLSGHVTADRIVSGANHLDKLALDVALAGPQTQFDLTGRFDDAPLAAKGTLQPQDGGLDVTLASFSAAPRKIPLTLARPTTVVVKGDAATLDDVVIKAGDGAIQVAGTAGRTLDLTVKAADLPVSLANLFAPGLDAAGILSANARVTGDATRPKVVFDSHVQDIATSQTRNAKLPPLTIAVTGQLADNRLSVTADSSIRDQAAKLTADVTLDGRTVSIPSFRADIGKSTVSGTLALGQGFQPSGKVEFDIPDADALASISGQKAEGAVKGSVDIASRNGAIDAKVDATGEIRNQAIAAKVEAMLDRGAIALPSLAVDIGRNTLAGAVTLDARLLPSGKITFDLPDLSLLAAMAGQKAEGALKGSVDIASADGRVDAEISATGAIRGQTVAIQTHAVSDKGAISLPSLTARIGPNTVSGAATLDSRFMPSGKIDFDLPDMALLAAMAGQKAEGALKGSADIASSGKRIDSNVTATGLIRGQAIDIKTTVVSDSGAISVPSLEANVGANTLSGTLALDKTFLPTGTFSFDFPDIGLLAAFAGQQAEGALKGSAAVKSSEGKISGTINASGETISASGVKIVNPSVDLAVADLLAGQISGHVRADQVAAGANHLDKLALDVALAGQQTRFDLRSRFDDAPLLAKGQLEPQDGGLLLTLSSFEGAPRKIPVRLASPTDIVIKNGVAAFKDLTIKAGDGSISVTGTAGTALDMTAKVAALPLSLANVVSPDLAAAGAISADIRITGAATDPVVAFDTHLRDVATAQTRKAKLPALDIAAKGAFAAKTLSVTADSALRGQPVNAKAEVTLNDGRVAVPSFSAAIGKSLFSGSIVLDRAFQPSGKIAFDIPDANALASIVGRKAEGAVKGTADIAAKDGKLGIKLTADGTVRKQAIKALADISLDKGAVSLPSLKLDVGKNSVSGAVALDQDFMPSGKITFDLPDVALLAALAGQKAEGAVKGTADITSDKDRIDAKIAATGLIRKQAIDVDLEAVRQGETISLPSLKIDVGRNTLSGALTLDKAFMPTGKVSFDFPDIALLAAFAGQKADGAIKGSADIKAENGKISGRISADGTRIVAAGAEIVKPAVDLSIADLATGQLSGKVTADRIASGANAVANLSLDFNHAGSKTGFDLKSRYDNAPLTAKGAIEQQPDGLTVVLDSFAAAPKTIAVKLEKPTRFAIKNGAVTLSALSIDAGKGKIAVNGSAGDKLDLTAQITALPASLANVFAPGLGAEGTISANVTVKGASTAPIIAFDTSWRNASVSQTRQNGLSNFSVTAKGQMANNVLTINADAKGAGGLSLDAGGTVGMTGNRTLSIKVDGQLPFAAIAAKLAPLGLDLRGNARFDLAVSGSAANPAISGRISTSGATLTAIRQNLTVKNLAADVVLDGRTARIASLNGNLSGGGTLSVSGTVGIAPNSGFPADIRIALKNAVYTDAKVVAAKLGGDMTLTGSLVRSPTLGGTIRISRADITIPQKLPGTLAQIRIRHKNASKAVLVQAKEIKENSPGAKTGKDAGGINFDLRIIAPRQVFVRGRGLDAELGGTIVLTGSARNPNAAGGFKMIRGRLSIIGRRLDFTEGEISFGGDLTPALNLIATSTVEATTINVTVAGLANNPQVTFTSSPALPQDEVMALLIFGRNSADLSPVQIAQLADAVSTLAGGQSNSLFNKLRQGLGVDDLDVGTDENGKSNVSVGKYLNKRTYLQLQQNVDDNTSSAIINLDIGKGVKLKGQAGTDGSTAGGVFFEKEY